jgi:hypothetical protein
MGFACDCRAASCDENMNASTPTFKSGIALNMNFIVFAMNIHRIEHFLSKISSIANIELANYLFKGTDNNSEAM